MSDDDTIETVALSWWKALQGDPANGWKGDPGALARLRRAEIVAAVLEPQTVALHRRLAPLFVPLHLKRDDAFARTALIAAVLSHVREHRSVSVAHALGAPDVDSGALKPLRFRRLLSTQGENDLLNAFRRIVALLDRKANVCDLARSLAEWDAGDHGDRRRMRWAFDYYDAGAAAPDDKTYDAA